ncbi:MAG: hypothetical protein FWH46_00420 [Methanimicrococcus sp.]|nr:hypothetical protein [Methanimicrococcus sp.]
MEDYWKHCNWEILAEPIEILEPFDFENYYEKYKTPLEWISSIKIKRNKQYKISAIARGFTPLSARGFTLLPFDQQKEGEVGKLIEYVSIKGTKGSSTVELNPCYVESPEQQHNLLKDTTKNKASITTYKIKKYNNNDKISKKVLKEWYINAPHSPRYLVDNACEEIKNVRICKKGNIEDRYERDGGGFYHTIHLKYEHFEFIITPIKDHFEPTWSKKISIEYREDLGGIPDENIREAIAEFFGFLIGKKVSLIGHTYYDDKGSTIEAMACNPNIFNIHNECSKPEIDLIPMKCAEDGKIFKKIFEELLPEYIKIRTKFSIREALMKYWFSQTIPRDEALPILSSGLEMIMKAWFKTKSPTGAIYMPQDIYDEKMSPIIKTILEIFKENQHKEKIKNKLMYNVNQMGVNERFFVFFDEIGLSYGDVEKKAIKERHSFAHGDLFQKEEINDLIKNDAAYSILFGKVILQLLGYKGKYIDRTVLGFPEKEMQEKMG